MKTHLNKMVTRCSFLLAMLVTCHLCDGQTSVCSSGDSRSATGTITSPNYPRNNYYNNLNCSYSVTAFTVSSISFTITDLNLESGSNCRYDWVEVSCRSHSVALPVKYCGTASHLAPVTFAPCTQAVVRFRTDGSSTFSGFSLDFRVTSLACANNCSLLFNSFGFICICRDNSTWNNATLPSAPPPPSCIGACDLYTSESTPYPFCYCSLNRQQLATTATTCSPGCFYDYDFYGRRYCRCLQTTSEVPCPSGCVRRPYLYGGGTHCDCTTADRTSSPCPFGCYNDRDFWGVSFCNCPVSTQPPIWCSPGCTSDINVYRERYCRCPTTTLPPCYSPCYYQYNDTYTYRGPRYCYCPTTTTPPPPTGCGRNYSAPSGIVTSPNYPNAYTKGIDCYQYITVPMAASMRLQMMDLNIYYSYSYSCSYEYVEITGCDNNVFTFCSLSTFPSTGLLFHCLYHTTTTIRFHSYASYYYYSTYRGFKLSYQASFVSNCSETSSYLSQGSTGVISSPNFPGDFPGHSECFNYLFTDDDDTLVKITFEQLRLEDSRTCGHVFLQLSCQDEIHVQAETICGAAIPRTLIFDCKSIRIWFKSNSSDPFSPRYFKLRYFATKRSGTGLPLGRSSPLPLPRGTDVGGVDPWKLGLVLGAGVGGFLFVVLIVLVVVISLCYRRQMARQEQRHLAELTAICSNLRNTCGDGNVTFSTPGRRENAVTQYNRSSSVPPPYASGETGGAGRGGDGEEEGGRAVGGFSDDDGPEATSDERMLLA